MNSMIVFSGADPDGANGRCQPGAASILVITQEGAAPLRALPPAASIPGIADQRFARPEQDHEQNPEHAQHREYRLLQHDLDDAGPEPGRLGVNPGAERLLAGLIHVVPELAELGEPQTLVGDPTRP